MARNEWLLSTKPISSQADTELYPFLIRLMRGENLSFQEAEEFFSALTSETANHAQIAAALVALTIKGETAEELAGMAKAMRAKAIKINTSHKNFIDTAGTGSGKKKVFNVSTASAFVIAGAGLPVAKHGNRAISSKTGSADVLEALGAKINVNPEIEESCLETIGICFMFAPKFHPALVKVGEVRRNLGIRTTMNLLGPLSNPAAAPKQTIGVWHLSLVEPMAKALALLNTEKAWVFHGLDGLDEITLSDETFVAEVTKDKVATFKIAPEDFGLKRYPIENLRVESPEASAEIIKEMLQGKRRDEARSLVIINAAAALFVAGLAENLRDATRLAEQSIDSGQAFDKLQKFVELTNK
ncbi:MAG: anthranilate phosphoribosyltransferase [Pyrinomonadaceae bacterium]